MNPNHPQEDEMPLPDEHYVEAWSKTKKKFTISDTQRAMMWGYNRSQSALSNLLEQGKIKQKLGSGGCYYQFAGDSDGR